jgi:hypothetical protein
MIRVNPRSSAVLFSSLEGNRVAELEFAQRDIGRVEQDLHGHIGGTIVCLAQALHNLVIAGAAKGVLWSTRDLRVGVDG